MYHYSIACVKLVACVAYFFLFLLFIITMLLFTITRLEMVGKANSSVCSCSRLRARLARSRFVSKSCLARRRSGRLARQYTPVHRCFLKKYKQALIDLLKLSYSSRVYSQQSSCDRDWRLCMARLVFLTWYARLRSTIRSQGWPDIALRHEPRLIPGCANQWIRSNAGRQKGPVRNNRGVSVTVSQSHSGIINFSNRRLNSQWNQCRIL